MKLPTITIVLALCGLGCIARPADAGIITQLVKTGGDTALPDPQIVADGLQDGALAYVDRTYTYINVPTVLRGVDYIQTENDDKNSQPTPESYQVTIGGPASLYVFVDQRLAGAGTAVLPWLTDGTAGAVFTRTSLTIDRSEPILGVLRNDVWSAIVSSGVYTFGDQFSASMYGIAATPVPEPSSVTMFAGILGSVAVALRRRNRVA